MHFTFKKYLHLYHHKTTQLYFYVKYKESRQKLLFMCLNFENSLKTWILFCKICFQSNWQSIRRAKIYKCMKMITICLNDIIIVGYFWIKFYEHAINLQQQIFYRYIESVKKIRRCLKYYSVLIVIYIQILDTRMCTKF